MYVTYPKILAHVRDYVRRFYGNCRTLIFEMKLFPNANDLVCILQIDCIQLFQLYQFEKKSNNRGADEIKKKIADFPV